MFLFFLTPWRSQDPSEALKLERTQCVRLGNGTSFLIYDSFGTAPVEGRFPLKFGVVLRELPNIILKNY